MEEGDTSAERREKTTTRRHRRRRRSKPGSSLGRSLVRSTHHDDRRIGFALLRRRWEVDRPTALTLTFFVDVPRI